MADVTRILWLDLETTGLAKPVPRPHDEELDDDFDIAEDLPLEIGCVMTNTLLEKRGQFARLIRWDGLDFADMPERVQQMHRDSGLTDDYAKHFDNPRAMGTVVEVEQALIDWMGRIGHETSRTMLAGSGIVHFDQFFLWKWMPKLMAELSHGLVDVGVLRRFADATVGPQMAATREVRPVRPHRALDDARAALRTAHRWAATMSQYAP